MMLPGGVKELAVVGSTQDVAEQLIKDGDTGTAVVWARHQTGGRGRFQREWQSGVDDSLTASFVFHEYAGHPEPWLVGMMVALAAAGTFHTQLRWPNDLTIKQKKVGGVLTELVPSPAGQKVPVVGVGVNLNQEEFNGDLCETATSLTLERGHAVDPAKALQRLLDSVRSMPEPTDWSVLQPIWRIFDDTPGKVYQLATGERAVAIGVGPDGRLICSIDGETQSVMAADALFAP